MGWSPSRPAFSRHLQWLRWRRQPVARSDQQGMSCVDKWSFRQRLQRYGSAENARLGDQKRSEPGRLKFFARRDAERRERQLSFRFLPVLPSDDDVWPRTTNSHVAYGHLIERSARTPAKRLSLHIPRKSRLYLQAPPATGRIRTTRLPSS